MNIVFIVGSYYPYSSAVSTCGFNIAEELGKQNNITVVCLQSSMDQSNTEMYQNQKIIRVTNKWWNIRINLDEKIKSNKGFKNKIYKLLLNGVKLRDYLSFVFTPVSLDRTLVNNYLSALGKIKEPIDVLIPLSFPMEAVIAGREYKKKVNIKLIPIIFDQFANSKTLHRLGINKRLKMQKHLDLEKSIINSSDILMVVHSQRKHFIENFNEKELRQKIQFIEHPLLKIINIEKEQKESRENNEICNLVFTGALLKGYVVPDYLFNILLIAKNKMEFRLNLYVSGNCNNTIEQYRQKMKSNVINHGFVSKQKALEAIYHSDILISIAELKGIQISSKIFEYMSVGKPIIHFYSADEDINVMILKNYPLKLCIKQDENLIEENLDKFMKFCLQNKNKNLDFSEVEKNYYDATPSFIATQIMETLEKN